MSFPRALVACGVPNGVVKSGVLKYDYVVHNRYGYNAMFADGSVFTKVARDPTLLRPFGSYQDSKWNVTDTAHPDYTEPWGGYTGDFW